MEIIKEKFAEKPRLINKIDEFEYQVNRGLDQIPIRILKKVNSNMLRVGNIERIVRFEISGPVSLSIDEREIPVLEQIILYMKSIS